MNIDIEQLKTLVDCGLTQRQIAKQLNFSQGKIKYWLGKLDIKTDYCKYKTNPKCKICGEKDPNLFYFRKRDTFVLRKDKCRNCLNKESADRFRNHKKEAVAYKGGKCVRCGYNKCLASLDFHHVNPNEKDLNWRKMGNWCLEKVKSELDKCELVCRNCHGEIHYLEN